MIEVCAGYSSQLLALKRLKQYAQSIGEDIDVECVAWSEFDPESNRPNDEQPAVVAHKILHPECADRNLGDMTKIDWLKFKAELMQGRTPLSNEEFTEQYTTAKTYEEYLDTPTMLSDKGKEIMNWDANIDILTYSTPCFVAGTLVMTDKGNVPIERIKVGDMVLTSDGYRKVTKFFDNGFRNTFKTKIGYIVDGERFSVKFEATPEHKFRTQRGWVKLKDLMHIDKIYVLYNINGEVLNGVEASIDIIEKTGDFARVYDIEVEDKHEFFAEGVLVHNCQSISNAGLQHGFEPGSGTRSSILWDTLKCIEVMRPKYLLQENVAAIVSEKFLPMFNAWQLAVEKLGYRNYTQLMNAKEYGVPQNRNRLFMLSVRDDLELKYKFPTPFKLDKTLEDVLEKNVDERYYIAQEKTDEWIAKERERLEKEGLI